MKKGALLLILTFVYARGQVLHHQGLFSQGKTTNTKGGFYVSQTIGQSITAESFNNSNIIIQQGFEMSIWSKFNKEVDNSNLNLKVKIYPNPFVSTINFSFPFEVTEEVDVSIIDVLGKIVFHEKTFTKQNNLSITGLEAISKGHYFLTLKTGSYIYSNQLIKL